MKRNLLVLMLLLVASGVTARYLHQPAGQPARENPVRAQMEESLCRLWGTPNNAVEFQPGPNGTDLWVTVFMPRGGGPERPTWNFALLRWLAARHPDLKPGQLRITDGHTAMRLLESPQESLREKKAVSASTPPEPAARTELMRRNAQTLSDGLMGRGQTLVLLETEPLPEADPAAVVGRRRPHNGPRVSGCLLVLGKAPSGLLAKISAGLREPQFRLVELPNP